MGDDARNVADRQRLTRRGLLAVAATGAVAGCQSIGGLSDDTDEQISVFDLPDLDRESIPSPIVARSVPVDIAPSHLTAARERVDALLGELPTPMGPDDIPNGYVRERLTDSASDATDALDDARTARTELEALTALGEARERARYAAAGWAMADDGLSVDGLRGEHGEIVSNAHAFWDEHTYRGTDPVRAALVHARIEDAFDRLAQMDGPRTHGDGALLTVAEWGETVESARVDLDDARHLDSQFTESLPADAGTVEDALTSGAETLLADVRSRRSQLPPEPTPEEWGVAENLVADLRRSIERGPATVEDARGPASAVVDATGRLARSRALEQIEERIDAGEISGVESADELRALRTTAYDALDAALEASSDAALARTVVGDVSWEVTNADWRLARFDRDVRPDRLDDIVEGYLLATAVARAVPPACDQTIDALN
ncbi:hypothetical protein GOC74_17160 [Halomicrobium mukohataei]|uniref:Uncharacterized protein n=1 Tax=Halomicrobium mukohataei TaxID=57705 RepID=A0A847U7D7_9EURY|nr:hypothetical protein [Halomicrobium mukohataei]NLV11653.1 hypothetical protein [Halomicrobium mukohataei]